MRLRTADAVLQRFGSCVLTNVSCGDVARKQAIMEAGGVAALAAAMGQHATDTALQRNGCGALMNLSTGDAACKQAIVDAGGGGCGGGDEASRDGCEGASRMRRAAQPVQR